MTLENQVVSLDLSKRLKELGFKNESLFYYYPKPKVLENSGGKVISDGYKVLFGKEARAFGKNAIISAYTVAELGEMLPVEVWLLNEPPFKKQYLLTINRYTESKDWSVSYVRNDSQDFIDERADTMANAMAKMLIYLKENNLI